MSQVFAESDQDKYDPKNKSRTARPYKPAILIE
jgi:leucyl-tRNA synthetase